MDQEKGFTLLEVMVSALLIMVGLGALGVTVVAGKRFLRQAECRSQAMGLASSKMEEYSERGYDILNNITKSGQEVSYYNWTARVVTRNATNTTITYRDIEVVVSYQEEDGNGGLDTKNIRLTNIVPYPSAHTVAMNIASSTGDEVPFTNQTTAPMLRNYTTIGESVGQSLMLNGTQLDFATKKDIEVAYSVSVGTDSSDNGIEIADIDTIYSACFFSNGLTSSNITGVEARTPIGTQASFNNVVVIRGVPSRNDNRIEIKWYYDRPTVNKTTDDYEYTTGYTNTKITLKKAILSMLAVEVK